MAHLFQVMSGGCPTTNIIFEHKGDNQQRKELPLAHPLLLSMIIISLVLGMFRHILDTTIDTLLAPLAGASKV